MGGTRKPVADYAKHSALGIQFALTQAAFAFAGYWLDRQLGWLPWCTVAGVLLGFTGGTVALYRQAFPARTGEGKSRSD